MLTNDKELVREWVESKDAGDFSGGCFAALGVLDNDKLVAGVVYDHYTETCVTATIAVEKKVLPRQLVRAMFRYPFEQLGVSKIIVYINDANKASVKLATKLGFAIEGKIKDVYPDGSMLIMGLPKANCVWLGV